MESVAIVGAGAMGGLYASHFARAGVPVTLVARGARARRMAASGLIVNGESVDAAVFDADHLGDPHPIDLVIVAVKHHQLAAALDDVAELVGPHTVFLSVLNGLDSEVVIADRFGAEHVLSCIALAMDAMRDGNEVTFRQPGRLVFGEESNTTVSGRVARVQQALDRAGLAWETPGDMRHEMWWKFMVNVGINQASAVLHAPYGAFRHEGPARNLMNALMREVIAVANAEGVALGAEDLRRWYDVLDRQPADGKTSMHQDVEAGRHTEVDVFAGRVVELGERHGIATPYNQAMHWIIGAGHDRTS